MNRVFSVLPSRIFFPSFGGSAETVSYSLEKSNSSPRSSNKIFLPCYSAGTTHKTYFWLKISKSVRTPNPFLKKKRVRLLFLNMKFDRY